MLFSSKNILIILAIFILAIFSFYLINKLFLQEQDLCAEFSIVEGEISCQKAIETALAEYPGKVYSVDKMEMPPLIEGQDSTEKFWAIGIDLNEPIEKELPAGSFANKAEIFISLDTGIINALQLK